MLKIKTIEPSTMPVSRWSGGTTTEIAIFPEGAKYSERDFLFRISTAKVELHESDFTSLPDYERVIASVEGRMELMHFPAGGESEEAAIEPRETVHCFDGSVPTHCVGEAQDLNLMLRKGRAEGGLRFLSDGEMVALELAPNEFALVYSLESGVARFASTDEDDFLVFMAEGCSALFTVRLIENR